MGEDQWQEAQVPAQSDTPNRSVELGVYRSPTGILRRVIAITTISVVWVVEEADDMQGVCSIKSFLGFAGVLIKVCA